MVANSWLVALPSFEAVLQFSVTALIGTCRVVSTSLAADIEALDYPVFDSKHVTDHFIREKVAVEVAD